MNAVRHRPSQFAAVIAREIRSRYTGDPLGYGWAYVTPLAWIAVIYAIFHLMGRSSPIDCDIGSFIISGVMPYLAFRYQVSAVLRAKATYRQFLSVPGTSSDVIYLSIVALEFYNALIIYLVLLGANALIFGAYHMADPLGVLWGFALTAGSGGALGYAIAGIGASGSSLMRATTVALRPLFYLSAVFYTADELPRDWLAWLSWNPLLHAIELTRSASFAAYSSQVASAWVPLGFIALCVAIGRNVTRGGVTADENLAFQD